MWFIWLCSDTGYPESGSEEIFWSDCTWRPLSRHSVSHNINDPVTSTHKIHNIVTRTLKYINNYYSDISCWFLLCPFWCVGSPTQCWWCYCVYWDSVSCQARLDWWLCVWYWAGATSCTLLEVLKCSGRMSSWFRRWPEQLLFCNSLPHFHF